MFSLGIDDDFDDFDTYDILGSGSDPDGCQERRPGGIWQESYSSSLGKTIGNDLTDCGGACCKPDTWPCTLLDEYGSAAAYPDGPPGVTYQAKRGLDSDHCKANNAGCACLCYGKQEGEFVAISFPPPPSSPPSSPLMCPMTYEFGNYEVDNPSFLYNEWGPVPEPSEMSGGNDVSGVDNMYLVNAETWESAGNTTDDLTALCCDLCQAQNIGLGWFNYNGVSISDKCDTIQTRSWPGSYGCQFLSTPGSLITFTPSAPGVSVTVRSNTDLVLGGGATSRAATINFCTPNKIDMQTVSCYATSESQDSNCNNAYDGVHDNLNSFFNGHGSDAARSWVADSITQATIRLTFTTAISFNYVTLWQRLYHGLDHQVTMVAIQFFDTNDVPVPFGGLSVHYMRLATAQNTNDHESFASRIFLWETVVGVHKVEIAILEAMDPDDVGIAEIEIGTRCTVESPPPPPPSASLHPVSDSSSSGAATHHGLLDGTIVGTAQLTNSNLDTCSSYCAIVSPGSIFNVFVGSMKPTSWMGCRCLDPTTTTLRANTTSFGYGVGVYSFGLSLSTYATIVSPIQFKSVVEGQTVEYDNGIVSASSAFKLSVSIRTGSSATAVFQNLLAVSTPFSSSQRCMPCIDASSNGIRVRLSTGGWTASAIAQFSVSNSRVYEISTELHNRVLVIRVTDFSNGDEHSGSFNLIFLAEYGPLQPMAIFAGKTVDGVSIDSTAAVDHATVSYTETLGSHEVASFEFETGNLFRNGVKFAPGVTSPPLFQGELAYPSRFTSMAAVAAGNACFDGTNSLVVNNDLSSSWRDTSTGGITMCTNVVAFSQSQMFPTIFAIGTDAVFNLFSYHTRVGAKLAGVDYDSLTPGVIQQNEKTHVCLSISTNNELTFYRNASRIARQTAHFDGVSATSKLALGADPFVDGTVRGLVGCLANVRVWARVLSDVEVASVAAAAAA